MAQLLTCAAQGNEHYTGRILGAFVMPVAGLQTRWSGEGGSRVDSQLASSPQLHGASIKHSLVAKLFPSVVDTFLVVVLKIPDKCSSTVAFIFDSQFKAM